jgi:hypothetical protein
MVQASIVGVIKVGLILLGVVVVLRFLGQLMNAKRNIEAQRDYLGKQRSFEEAKRKAEQDKGKLKITDKKQKASDYDHYTDFEEIN